MTRHGIFTMDLNQLATAAERADRAGATSTLRRIRDQEAVLRALDGHGLAVVRVQVFDSSAIAA